MLVRMKANVDVHYKGDQYENVNLSFLLNRERNEDVESICEMTSNFIQDPYFGKKCRIL